MPVYVDKKVYPLGRMLMCHMLADTLDELHLMADKIGIQRKWFQKKSIPHYDICQSKRSLALKYGAIEIDNKRLVELIKHYRNQINREICHELV